MDSVKLSKLLWVYAAVPLVLLVVFISENLLKSSLVYSMPFRPEKWALWIYIFGMPHVFASMQTMMDKEYLRFYNWRLIGAALFFLALPIVVSNLAGGMAMFLIFTAFIVYHTVAQQFGLTLTALKAKPDATFYVWKWSAIGLGLVLYGMLYTTPLPIAFKFSSVEYHLLLLIAKILLVAIVASGLLMAWLYRANKMGLAYLGANTALMATEFALFQMGYFAFVVILGRVIHELTAWPIYATHDKNRNSEVQHNWLYRAFKKTRIPTYWLSIALAFALGWILTYSTSVFRMLSPLIVSLSLFHYYTESFMWKGASIHRKFLSFK